MNMESLDQQDRELLALIDRKPYQKYIEFGVGCQIVDTKPLQAASNPE